MNPLRHLRPSVLLAALITMPVAALAQSGTTILHAPEASKLLPDAVYYAGKSANTQLRNSAGIKFADGRYVLAVLVDTSGYSTSVQEKYQGYLLNESAIDIGGKPLAPGAYGIGFAGHRFVVTDIGAHDILQAPSQHDENLQRPMPLQIIAGDAAGHYRLCLGRDCVALSRP
ncbi:MAG: hypothetical protein ACLGXA_02980 [Acidobacteriota bacterium]